RQERKAPPGAALQGPARGVFARKRSNLWHVFPAGLNSGGGLQTHTPNYAKHSLLRILAMTAVLASQ
ncbi:MAG: hypothetical protein Q8R50_06730, partial [Sediminibacterium sp.]|nr:hypothetical protein [Sediminibacterium sp.]